MRTFVFLGLAVLVAVAACWTAVFFLQRSVLFPAPRAPGALPPSAGAEAIGLPHGGYALFLAPGSPVPARAPLLIYTHGNGELARDWVSEFAVPRSWGWAALLVEYPGYGGAAGRPTEASINAAVGAAYEWARRQPGIDGDRIVAYGRSIGGGPATRLAATRPVAALILESSFTSVASLAARFLVPAFLVRDRFDNLAALATYRAPLLVVHGEMDQVVPVREGKRLAAAVPGAEFIEMPACGHNDCPRPWPAIKAFLERHGLSRPLARQIGGQ